MQAARGLLLGVAELLEGSGGGAPADLGEVFQLPDGGEGAVVLAVGESGGAGALLRARTRPAPPT
ncbi:MAG: hypothetical protein ACQEXM_19815, partial [Actinomycetota bacterium]